MSFSNFSHSFQLNADLTMFKSCLNGDRLKTELNHDLVMNADCTLSNCRQNQMFVGVGGRGFERVKGFVILFIFLFTKRPSYMRWLVFKVEK